MTLTWGGRDWTCGLDLWLCHWLWVIFVSSLNFFICKWRKQCLHF